MIKYGLPIPELIIAHRHLPQVLTPGSSARLKLKKDLPRLLHARTYSSQRSITFEFEASQGVRVILDVRGEVVFGSKQEGEDALQCQVCQGP